jgi:arylsulfatase A-like enzyme
MNKNSTINRRDFVKRICLGTISSAAIMTFPGLFDCTKSKHSRYNVLFIAVDDLRPQLGCYGQKQMISPNIDLLASQGLLFERAYCQQAVCAPSRISLLSGLRPDSTGIYDLEIRLSEALPKHISLPKYFKQNRYETISLGKIYHHYDDDLDAWSKKPFLAKGKGLGYITKEGRRLVEENQKSNPKAVPKGPPTEMADVPDNAYSDGRLTDHAIKEMNRMKERLFFLCVGYRKPHLPFAAPKKYWDMYHPERLKLADNPFFPRGVTKFTLTNFNELRNYFGMPKGKEPISDKQARHLIHGYYACVSFIDAQVGRLMNELTKLNLRDKTVIILWGDHGWKLGEHASWCKHTNVELDTRVPLIISVPGMKAAGQRTKALTEFVDIYPTLCEVCGLGRPVEQLEGTSFAPLLDDPNRNWKKAAFSQYPRGSLKERDKMVMGYSMRTERFRYTEWKHLRSRKILARELYDHKRDPQENVNVIDDPRYTTVLKNLEGMMKRGWKSMLIID